VPKKRKKKKKKKKKESRGEWRLGLLGVATMGASGILRRHPRWGERGCRSSRELFSGHGFEKDRWRYERDIIFGLPGMNFVPLRPCLVFGGMLQFGRHTLATCLVLKSERLRFCSSGWKFCMTRESSNFTAGMIRACHSFTWVCISKGMRPSKMYRQREGENK
jgi:hypothetical protein